MFSPIVAIALVTTRGIDPGVTARPAVIAIAALEVGASISLLLALQRGPVSIASVLASLYPVATTFLAAGLLHERLRPTQLAGVGPGDGLDLVAEPGELQDREGPADRGGHHGHHFSAVLTGRGSRSM